MEAIITKLGEVIDELRTLASSPEYAPYLEEWLKDPALDNWEVEKLLHLRYALQRLVQERANLTTLMKEDEKESLDDEELAA